jgi:opacity protein-like surface antigen
MNKKSYVLVGLMFLAAVLLVLPVGAKAEMYVEGYIGGVQAASDPKTIHTTEAFWETESSRIPGKFDPAVMGGLKVGTWFVKEGFLGANYPDWMKYFGFNLDFSYHRLDLRQQQGVTFSRDLLGLGLNVIAPNKFFSEGTAATLAFMFTARYGFLQDSEVPFGRLQPYLSVGPAILFSTMEPKLNTTCSFNNSKIYTPGSRSSVDIALAAEAGVRWMCLKNVSVDLAFKYRYANPTYSFGAVADHSGVPSIASFSISPVYHLFSGQLGAAYHF